MTRRLGRGTAGRRVLTRIGEYSAALLAEEERCFAEMHTVFDRHGGPMIRQTGLALKRVKGVIGLLASDADWPEQMATRHANALGACLGKVETLADRAVRLAVTAIGDELAHCEATLAVKYAGVTGIAVAATQEKTAALVEVSLASFRSTFVDAPTWFAEDWRHQVGLAYSRQEDEARLMKRLFSPDPANLVGCGGRGVWWSVTSTLNGAAREVAIGVGNATRETAMRAFNEAARGR